MIKATPKPKKSLGQNFLVDGRVRELIVDAADLTPEDVVVEIGPGRGFLTASLARESAHIVAVEIDGELAGRLSQKYSNKPNLRVVHADAREIEVDSLVPPGTRYKLVANLPYYAANHIIRRFLEVNHRPRLMVVMVQREVALELAATTGQTRLLSVATQMFGRPRIITEVPPSAFRPKPKVVSAVVRIDTYDRPAVEVDSTPRFFDLVRAGFAAPRKQLRNSLSQGLAKPPSDIQVLLDEAGIDPMRRAQTLSLEEWGSLYHVFVKDRMAPSQLSLGGAGSKQRRAQ